MAGIENRKCSDEADAMSKRRSRVKDGQTWYNIPLCMSVPDIAKNYREAKRPAEQINILADMNDTLPCRIAWLLKRCGCEVPGKKLPRPPRKDDTIDYVALWEQSDDARIADEYRTKKENEAMNEVPETIAAEAQQKPEPAAKVQHKSASNAAKSQQAPEIQRDPHSASVYMDTVDGFWTTYLGVRYGVALTHEDIVHLVELSDIARAAAGGVS